MYPVSDKFQEEMVNMRDRKIYGLVEIDYTSVDSDESVLVESNDIANVSHLKQISDGVLEPRGKILSLDGTWVLNGSYVFAPSDSETNVYQMGWWGSKLSNSNGTFTGENPRISTIFSPRTIQKITVVGDNYRNEYPVDFNVNFYRDDIMVKSVEIRNNVNVRYKEVLTVPETGIGKLELEIMKWNKPNRQVKILEFYTLIREIYDMEDIMDINLVEQRSSQLTGLPIGSITNSEIRVKLNNEDGVFDINNTQSPLYNLLLPNRRISPYLGVKHDDGTMEYVPLGVFWSDSWSVSDDTSHAEVVGRDTLKFLEETDFKLDNPILNENIYNFAEMVLLDSGLNQNEFYIDNSFREKIIPVIHFKDKINHREVLRLISEVALGQIYCDRDGRVVVQDMYPITEVINVNSTDSNRAAASSQLSDDITDMETDYMILNGTSTLSENNRLAEPNVDRQIGWMNNRLSDVNGNFNAPYPTINFEFEPRSVNSITLYGDNYRGEYPVNFDITLYDNNDNILNTKVVRDNNEIMYSELVYENPTNVSRVELIIYKWSKPNDLIKLAEFALGDYKLRITKNDYFTKNNPLNYDSLANRIEVEVQPVTNTGEDLDSYNVTLEDNESIGRFGLKRQSLSGNRLIQDSETANFIASSLLKVYKMPQRSLELDWRGNPSLLLGGLVGVVGDNGGDFVDYRVSSQDLKYDGALRGSLTAIRDYISD